MKNLRDSYKFYKEKYSGQLDIKTYLIINHLYNKFLIDKIGEGYEVTLPARLGTLGIIGKKQKISVDEKGNIKGLAPDWVRTKKLWEENEEAKKNKKLLYHLNNNTDNVRYKYLWRKKNVLVENKTLYSLRMTRTNKRFIHNLIKQGKQFKLM